MFKSCIWNCYLPTWGFPGGAVMPMQEMTEMQVDPWLKRSPGVGNGNPQKYSCLKNPTDRGVW